MSSRAVDPSLSSTPLPPTPRTSPPSACCAATTAASASTSTDDRIVDGAPRQDEPDHARVHLQQGRHGRCTTRTTRQRVEHPLRRRADGSLRADLLGQAIAEIAAKLSRDPRRPRRPRDRTGAASAARPTTWTRPAAPVVPARVGSRRWFNAYAQEKTQHNLSTRGCSTRRRRCSSCTPTSSTPTTCWCMGTNPKISNRGHNANETFKQLAGTRRLHGGRGRSARDRDHAQRRPPSARAARRRRLLPARHGRRDRSARALRRGVRRAEDRRLRRSCATRWRGWTSTRWPPRRARRGRDPRGRRRSSRAPSRRRSCSTSASSRRRSRRCISYLIRVDLDAHRQPRPRAAATSSTRRFTPPERSRSRHEEPERALASGIPAIRALGNCAMFSPTLVPEEVMLDHPERMRASDRRGVQPVAVVLRHATRGARRSQKLDLLVVDRPVDDRDGASRRLRAARALRLREVGDARCSPRATREIDVQLRPPVMPGPAEALPEPEIYVRLARGDGNASIRRPTELASTAPSAVTPEARALFLMTAMGRPPRPRSAASTARPSCSSGATARSGPQLPAPALVAMWAQVAAERDDPPARPCCARSARMGRKRGRSRSAKRSSAACSRTPRAWRSRRIDPERNLDDIRRLATTRACAWRPAPMLGELERALRAPVARATRSIPFVLVERPAHALDGQHHPARSGLAKGARPALRAQRQPRRCRRARHRRGRPRRMVTKRGAVELPAAIDERLRPDTSGCRTASASNTGMTAPARSRVPA